MPSSGPICWWRRRRAELQHAHHCTERRSREAHQWQCFLMNRLPTCCQTACVRSSPAPSSDWFPTRTCAVAHHPRLLGFPRRQLIWRRGPNLAVAEEPAHGGAREVGLHAERGHAGGRNQRLAAVPGRRSFLDPWRHRQPMRPATPQTAHIQLLASKSGNRLRAVSALHPSHAPAPSASPHRPRRSIAAPWPRKGTAGSRTPAPASHQAPAGPAHTASRLGTATRVLLRHTGR